MPSHSEIRILPYDREQVFNIVANVEEYPDFLPWCLSCEKTLVYDNGYVYFYGVMRAYLTPFFSNIIC